MLWIAVYFGVFAAACGLGATLTFAARAVAPRLGVVDRPAGRKDHARVMPVNGGWAIYATVVLMAGAGGLLAPAIAPHLPSALSPLVPYLENLAGVRGKLGAILLGYTMIFLVGAVDDVKPLGPRLKLAAQALAVVPLILAGVSIHLFLPFPVLGWAVTLLWAIALMNSFNFMDNMDGLTAAVAAVIAVVLALAAAQGGSLVSPALFLIFAGALVGFLIFNWNPASIFLGDSGALSIGYLLAAFSIMPEFWRAGHQPTGLPVLIPLAVMGVPLFDTISVMLIRLRKGAPLMVGDHNHFSHRLRSMGMTVRQTAVTIGLLTAASGLLALALRRLDLKEAIIHLVALALLFGAIGAIEFFSRSGEA